MILGYLSMAPGLAVMGVKKLVLKHRQRRETQQLLREWDAFVATLWAHDFAGLPTE